MLLKLKSSVAIVVTIYFVQILESADMECQNSEILFKKYATSFTQSCVNAWRFAGSKIHENLTEVLREALEQGIPGTDLANASNIWIGLARIHDRAFWMDDCTTFKSSQLDNVRFTDSETGCVAMQIVNGSNGSNIYLSTEDCDTEHRALCTLCESLPEQPTASPYSRDPVIRFIECFGNPATYSYNTAYSSDVTSMPTHLTHHRTSTTPSTQTDTVIPVIQCTVEGGREVEDDTLLYDCKDIDQKLESGNFSVTEVEESLKKIAFRVNNTTTVKTSRSTLSVWKSERSEFCAMSSPHDRFKLECTKLSKENTDFVVVATEVEVDTKSITSFIPTTNQKRDEDNTKVIKIVPNVGKMFSVSAYNWKDGNTLRPDRLTFSFRIDGDDTMVNRATELDSDGGSSLDNTYRAVKITYDCVTLDPNTKIFSPEGCTCYRAGAEANCTSSHNSMFAVLFSVEAIEVPSKLKILTIVMQTISVFFLIITFIILLRVRKKVRGERIPVQINLVVSLMMLHIWTLLHDLALMSSTFCEAVAVLTHFFLISSALWMTVEAVMLFIKTSRWAFLQVKRKKLIMMSMSFAWGLSAFICILCAAIGFATNTYMDRSGLTTEIEQNMGIIPGDDKVRKYDICWLSSKSGIRYSVIVPVGLSLLVNSIIAIRVTMFVYRKRGEVKNFRPTEQPADKRVITKDYLNKLAGTLKALTLLLPVLGLPWIIGFSINIGRELSTLHMAYVNAVLNGLQGVGIFIVYCVVGREVRDAATKSLPSISSTWQSLSEGLERRRRKSSPYTTDHSIAGRNSVTPINNNIVSDSRNCEI